MTSRRREIEADEFAARCPELLDEVRHGGAEIVITERGQPVAKLVPAAEDTRARVGAMKGTVTILGDVVAPLDVAWEAELPEDKAK